MSGNSKIRVAVVGVGHLGKEHARIYAQLEGCELIGVVDVVAERAAEVASHLGTQAFRHFSEILGKVDAVSLAVPTQDHQALACELLEAGVDVLVEKPITRTLAEADAVIACAKKNQRILQVGHLERFNPAVTAVKAITTSPKFFEVHRLSMFTPRSLDIDVVFDLMIHDLDIVLSLVQSPLKQVHAVGIPILTDKVDIANARLEFEDGCVANLTASRASIEKVRKLRFFQPSEYISIDYTRQDAWVIHVDRSRGAPQILPRMLETQKEEPLMLEIQSFLECVKTRQAPTVSGEDGRRALAVATDIGEKIEAHNRVALGART